MVKPVIEEDTYVYCHCLSSVSDDGDDMASLSNIEESNSEDESKCSKYHNDCSTFQIPTKTNNKDFFSF